MVIILNLQLNEILNFWKNVKLELLPFFLEGGEGCRIIIIKICLNHYAVFIMAMFNIIKMSIKNYFIVYYFKNDMILINETHHFDIIISSYILDKTRKPLQNVGNKLCYNNILVYIYLHYFQFSRNTFVCTITREYAPIK